MEAITHNKILRLLRTYLFKAKRVWRLRSTKNVPLKLILRQFFIINTKNNLNCSPAIKI